MLIKSTRKQKHKYNDHSSRLTVSKICHDVGMSVEIRRLEANFADTSLEAIKIIMAIREKYFFLRNAALRDCK